MAKKRANGEGSIRKKPSGRWEGRYTQGIDPVTGKAIQESVSAKTQAECKEKLAKAIRENRGVPLNHTGDYTAAEWCRLWFETYSKPNIRYNTAKGYEGIIEHHIIPAIGAIKLKQLSSIHIQRMYNDLKENGRMPRGAKQNDKALSNTFVRRVHAVLQAALKQAVKERLIPYNPCDNCRIPPKEKKEMTIIPPEKTDDSKITIGGLDANVWMTKYGNVYTDCKAKDFMGKLGFAWGDLVTVKFLDKTLTLPVVPTYSYVDSGKPAIIVEKDADGKPTGYVSMAINMGNFAETYELAKKHTNEDKTWYWTAWEGVTYPVEVTFKMAEKGGYMAEYIMHDLQIIPTCPMPSSATSATSPPPAWVRMCCTVAPPPSTRSWAATPMWMRR
jgi:S-adenosylmethionine hydrolase